MRTIVALLGLACLCAEPASAETWICPDGHYAVHEDSVDRDTPPLSYKLVQNDDIGIVAVAPDSSSGFVGMAGILLRKSDGMLMRFGHAMPSEPSKHTTSIGGSRTEHCHPDRD